MFHAFRGPAPEPPPGALVAGKTRGTASLLRLQLRHLNTTCAQTGLPETRREELVAQRGQNWGALSGGGAVALRPRGRGSRSCTREKVRPMQRCLALGGGSVRLSSV